MNAPLLKDWELENAIALVDPHRDALYAYDNAEQQSIQSTRPWKKDMHYFQHVRISAVALLKMVMHARSGGNLEIMGLMQGKISGDTFIVTDALRLPVEGTETRVNAQNEAEEYMPEFLTMCRETGQLENAVGWYHSHPGYGCWLSGIDVDTQDHNQTYQDPFLAVVIDPHRTISAGKVEIGAFRTLPKEYKPPPGRADDGYQTIPLAKMQDFGAHSSRYYSLDISHYKSSLDSQLLELLWNKYWVSTLNQSPLFTNRDYGTKQIQDLSRKMNHAETSLISKSRSGHAQLGTRTNKTKDSALDKVIKDSNKVVSEEIAGLMSGVVKDRIFNRSE
ncbi:MAG: COP9 signalosome catalytic subunit rri1 [Vezdaea aestivalis]|nr:MAG: COP9 signalosome catalytic subunit rri1 [Vezdaea aestivalis]